MFRLTPSQDLPLLGRPSAAGLVLGAACFTASLTPSLIPRAGLVQGALAGVCFAAGYLIGWALVALWVWLFEPGTPAPRSQRRALRLAGVAALALAGWGLWNVTGWQNGIHQAMDIPPVESARPFTILAVATLLALLLVLLGRLFRRLWRVISAQLQRLIPRRLALALGLFLAGLLFWAVGNDLVLARALGALDDTYAALDRLMPDDQAPPPAGKTGGPASLVGWEGLGAAGRNWVLDGPDAATVTALTGLPAREPLRIYVGLNNADTAADRARLALAEALRQGAFDRKVLVIATPTGTGWMDPAAMQPLDYLTQGDVATVAVQYSYLPSWMTLILQPEYGAETAAEVFRTFYDHWHSLPRDSRPQLYLFGLSLGARNGELAVWLPKVLGDPMQGALWAGPPFADGNWRQVITGRNAGSPAWAPQVGDGSVIRVTTQENSLRDAPAPWGAVRIVYLAYPSDPIAHFSADLLWRRPSWLADPPGPDVSPGLRWFPVVTFLQVGFDMLTATTTPPGRGHVYAGADYLDAWAEVLALDWPAERLEALRAMLAGQGL